jgi:hypothetical protein
MKEKLYEVTVEVSFTKRYYIHAPTEEKIPLVVINQYCCLKPLMDLT